MITNPSTTNIGEPFSISLSYNPASFTLTGSSYFLTGATVTLQFDGSSFAYTAANYIEFATPGAYGAGAVSFLIYSSLVACGSGDFLTLYQRQSLPVRVPAQLRRRESNRSAGHTGCRLRQQCPPSHVT